MRALDALIRRPPAEVQRYVPPEWMQPYIDNPPPGWIGTWASERAEPISATFCDFASAGLGGNTVIASVERVRMSVFSEARFQFQRFVRGRPSGLFGLTGAGLELLERPWTGGTTGDMLTRMIVDADLAGNSFQVMAGGELVRLRPDWVEIVLTERYDDQGQMIGWARAGYLYYHGGKATGVTPAVFLPEEVAHFAPLPDPLATYRGMSWLTPVVREIQADTMATRHKLKFFENAATPNLAVSLPKEIAPEAFEAFVQAMDASHKGADNAYKTLYTGGGADVTVIGANMQQLDFKLTQGTGETRICAAGGIHPAIVALSEGLQGASLNAGNFGAARRLVADGTMRPLWRNAAGSLEVLVPPPGPDSRLWYDDRDVAFLREDARDAADIVQVQAATITELVKEGFTPASSVAAVISQNMDLLEHTGLVSVQLQPPGGPASSPPEVQAARNLVEMVQKVYLGVGTVISEDEARALLNQAGAGLAVQAPPLRGAPVLNGSSAGG